MTSKIYYSFSDKNIIEGSALQQFERTAAMDGIISAVGHADMHPGKGYPVGASFLTQKIIYPYLIGNDIGCGMSLFETDISPHCFKMDKMIRALDDLESPLNELPQLPNELPKSTLRFESSLGTLGGGNHFAEFMRINKSYSPEILEAYHLNPKKVYLLIHSGSRGLGESILRNHIQKFSSQGLRVESVEAQEYLQEHNYACNWASFNRKVVAMRIAKKCHLETSLFLEQIHNQIEKRVIDNINYFIHRKGAARVDSLSILPGSRGSYTYLLRANFPSLENHFSLPHGAGRKWQRGHVKDRLSHKYRVEDLQKTELGNFVICEDKELLYDEAPQAYKNIERIIDELLKVDAISKEIIQFTPLLTYKKRQRQW